MTKAIINFKTIHKNIKNFRSQLHPKIKFCAVVKANAYSLGLIPISREIQNSVDYFSVACMGEALKLRTAGIKKAIILFGVCEDYKLALANNITISINSVKEMKCLVQYMSNLPKRYRGKKCKIHIKVNTGMNRYGISNIWQLKGIIQIIKENPKIQLEGLYTQLAHNMHDIDGINNALKRFAPFRSIAKSYSRKVIIHAACSNNYEHIGAQFDMVRIGKIMYGGHPAFKTAITITSKIVAVQTMAEGEKVGYNGTETVKRPTIAAVVPCGYADLIHYRCSNTYKVLVDGKLYKILGRVCMDAIIIDATDICNPLGKTVTIMDNKKGVTLMDMGTITNTNVCNILCSFNFDRVELVYK